MSIPVAKPVVVVCGATGAQGSSVARYLLRDGGYTVRALTRNISSQKAMDLKRQGAVVVACDLGDAEQVVMALRGAYAVFGLTNFWEHGEEAEINQGKNLANAAKACGVKHFIWSSLPHIEGLEPRHWESKVAVERYLRDADIPTTAILASFYFENLWMFFPLKQLSDGSLSLDWFPPSGTLIPSFAVEDLGAWFMIALKNPEDWIGRKMTLCVQKLTPRDYGSMLSEALGTNVTLKEVSATQFEEMRPHVPVDLWLNFKAFLDQPTLLDDAVDPSRQLYPGAQGLKQFAEKYREKILGAAVPA